MIRVVATDDNKKVGSVLDTDDTLEAVKMFIEKLQEQEVKINITNISIDTEVEYI